MAFYQRRSRTEWQSLIDEFDSSEQSVAAFCAERGVGAASFYQWRKRLSTPAQLSSDDHSMRSFVDVSSLAAGAMGGGWLLELDLGDGLMLRLNRC